jgi:hypothetical protein
MADFREVLEVSKNSTCFLSFSFCKTKEDLAVVDDDQLPNPPMEIEFADDATLGEVADLIERFSENEQQCFAALQKLQNNGRITMVDEY